MRGLIQEKVKVENMEAVASGQTSLAPTPSPVSRACHHAKSDLHAAALENLTGQTEADELFSAEHAN